MRLEEPGGTPPPSEGTSSPALRLLGTAATWHGQALTGRALDLVCRLALAEGETVGLAELVDALWPEERPGHPHKALQVAVSRARGRLGSRAVVLRGEGYALGLGAGEVDYLALAQAARLVDDAVARQDLAAIVALTGTSELGYGEGTGPLDLPGPRGALSERARTLRVRCMRERALALETLGRAAEAMELLPGLAERNPADEAILAALVRAEAWAGSPSAALARYEAYRQRLRDRGAVPGPRLRAAHEAALSAERPVRRGLRTPARLVGRDDDLREVEAAVATGRLVTLTGPGGVGKTSLAQALASQSTLPVVYVLPMTEISPQVADTGKTAGRDTATHLASDILAALGHSPGTNTDPRQGLAHALEAPGTLLVLDDCEHVSEELADLLGPLLAAASGLRVLITSRRALDLGAEHVHRLAPLAHGDAARLFRDRALAARPRQVISDADLERLLPALDGIPLAIELAAARTRVMSVAQVADRLARDLPTLNGPRDLPARQRTLAAVIEWSWKLLDDAQRGAMTRLALLAGGFTLETAEVVLGSQAPVLLDALVSQSLLEVEEPGPARGAVDAGPRFRMLASVRELVRSRPADPARAAQDRAAVRAWALGLCRLASNRARATGLLDGLLAEEAGLTQELRRALDAWERDGAEEELEDACTLGAALVSCWATSWGFPQLAGWAPRLARVAVTPATDAEGARARVRILYRLCASTWLLGPLPEPIRSAVPPGGAVDDAEGTAIRRLAATRRQDWPALTQDADVWVVWAAGSCVSSDLENLGRVDEALALTDSLIERATAAGLPEAHLVELGLDRLRLLLELGHYARAGRECVRLSDVLERSTLPQRALYLQLLHMQRRCCQVYADPTPEATGRVLEEFGAVSLPGTAVSVLSFVGSEMKVLGGRAREAAIDNRRFLDVVDLRTTGVPDGGPWEQYGLATCLVIDAGLTPAERAGLDLLAVRRRAARVLRRALSPAPGIERDLPTVSTLAAALGLSVLVEVYGEHGSGAPQGSEALGKAGAELLAVALRAGHNQTCLILSRGRLEDAARAVNAGALHEATGLVEQLERASLVERMSRLAAEISEWL